MPRLVRAITRLLPGAALSGGIAFLAEALGSLEQQVVGRPYLEALVIAILIGVAVRTAWTPGAAWSAGINFSAKTLLEFAVMLLGASMSLQMILSVGAGLLLGIATVVVASLLASYAVGRGFGLPHRLSLLVACGNSICGNSAIAAAAPMIGAAPDDIASSIAFTAILGVAVVAGLPLLVPLLHLSETQYGVLAGLTVYAVPQVLAATAPVGFLSVQVATLVKLLRVLMLGPLVLALSLFAPRAPRAAGTLTPLSLTRLVPWFIIGFVVLAGFQSMDLIPKALLGPLAQMANRLTVVAMAALGLGVDMRALGQVGGRVIAAAAAALGALGAMSLFLIWILDIA